MFDFQFWIAEVEQKLLGVNAKFISHAQHRCHSLIMPHFMLLHAVHFTHNAQLPWRLGISFPPHNFTLRSFSVGFFTRYI